MSQEVLPGIQPFLKATTLTFHGLFGLEVAEVPNPDLSQFNPEVRAIVTISGTVRAVLIVSVDRHLAMQAAKSLTGGEYTSLEGDVIDVIGEMANIIGGNAKAGLGDLGLTLSVPTIVVGCDSVVRTCTDIPLKTFFYSASGRLFSIEVGVDQ